jgi:hypothetical protein
MTEALGITACPFAEKIQNSYAVRRGFDVMKNPSRIKISAKHKRLSPFKDERRVRGTTLIDRLADPLDAITVRPPRHCLRGARGGVRPRAGPLTPNAGSLCARERDY